MLNKETEQWKINLRRYTRHQEADHFDLYFTYTLDNSRLIKLKEKNENNIPGIHFKNVIFWLGSNSEYWFCRLNK